MSLPPLAYAWTDIVLTTCTQVDAAVASGQADLSVHSLKDAPPTCPPGLLLACCLPREDVRDVAVFRQGLVSLGENRGGDLLGGLVLWGARCRPREDA